jgi:REP element-mobilizing transposase RayT
MLLGYHLILSAYGFWLPNDPRGSWSDFVGAWELLRYGPATHVKDGRSHAHDEHDVALRLEAKKALKYPAVLFDGVQARAVARGFQEFAWKVGLHVWACALLPDHIHLVVAQHRLRIEQIANLLKGAASRQLVREDIHPLRLFKTQSGRCPKAFSRGQWKVFIDSEEQLQRAIEYVNANPEKEGKRRQNWTFVEPVGDALR